MHAVSYKIVDPDGKHGDEQVFLTDIDLTNGGVGNPAVAAATIRGLVEQQVDVPAGYRIAILAVEAVA